MALFFIVVVYITVVPVSVIGGFVIAAIAVVAVVTEICVLWFSPVVIIGVVGGVSLVVALGDVSVKQEDE